jgi:hypothetical protein
MVAGATADGGPRSLSMDDLLTRLDRFTSTPTGSLTILLLTALIRLIAPKLIARRRARKAEPRKAAPNA